MVGVWGVRMDEISDAAGSGALLQGVAVVFVLYEAGMRSADEAMRGNARMH
jgi:hypothetical protein